MECTRDVEGGVAENSHSTAVTSVQGLLATLRTTAQTITSALTSAMTAADALGTFFGISNYER